MVSQLSIDKLAGLILPASAGATLVQIDMHCDRIILGSTRVRSRQFLWGWDVVKRLNIYLVLWILEWGFLPWAWADESMQIPPLTDAQTKAYAECKTATELMMAGKKKEALEKFKDAESNFPPVAELHLDYATVLYRNGDVETALLHAKEAVRLKPTLAPAWIELATLYEQLLQWEEAVVALEHYSKLCPNDSDSINRTIAKIKQDHLLRPESTTSINAPDYLDDLVQIGCARWPKKRQPITVFIQSGEAVEGFRPEMESALRQAFADWEEATKPVIEFKFVNSPSEAMIHCSWIAGKDGVNSFNEGGHAEPSIHADGISRCDLVLCTKPNVSLKSHLYLDNESTNLSDSRLHFVALHEVGHAIGLPHSRNPNDVMFPTCTDDTKKLSERDVATVRALYGAAGDAAIARPENAERIEASTTRVPVPPGYGKSTVINGEDAVSLCNRGAKELNLEKNFAAAIKDFSASLAIDPSSKVAEENLQAAYYNCAIDHYKNQRWGPALDMFKKAFAIREKRGVPVSDSMYMQNVHGIIECLQLMNRDAEVPRWQSLLTNHK